MALLQKSRLAIQTMLGGRRVCHSTNEACNPPSTEKCGNDNAITAMPFRPPRKTVLAAAAGMNQQGGGSASTRQPCCYRPLTTASARVSTNCSRLDEYRGIGQIGVQGVAVNSADQRQVRSLQHPKLRRPRSPEDRFSQQPEYRRTG